MMYFKDKVNTMTVDDFDDKFLLEKLQRRHELVQGFIKQRRKAASKLVTQANKLRGYLIQAEKIDGVERSRTSHKAIWRTTARSNHVMFELQREAVRLKTINNIAAKYTFCKETGKFKSKFVKIEG